MKKINSTKKAVEFLVNNQTGEISKLEKINEGICELFKTGGYLIIKGDKYQFTQEGIDFYCQNYAPIDKERKGLFGILPSFSMVFR